MSDQMQAAQWAAEEFGARFAQVFDSMTGERPATAVRPAGQSPIPEDLFWWEERFNIIDGPALWVAAERSLWEQMGVRTLQAAGIDTVEPSEAKNTYLELLSQTLSSVCQSIALRLGRECVSSGGGESYAPASDIPPFEVHLAFSSQPPPPFYVVLSDELVQAVRSAQDRVVGDLNALSAVQEEPKSLAPAPAAVSKTMELLLDVELPLSISFGRAELPLRDVLKLSTGSIVELNRTIADPVEVIVNNCVVARGEVVVVDGNYGIKIQQIISRQERLRTLK